MIAHLVHLEELVTKRKLAGPDPHAIYFQILVVLLLNQRFILVLLLKELSFRSRHYLLLEIVGRVKAADLDLTNFKSVNLFFAHGAQHVLINEHHRYLDINRTSGSCRPSNKSP